MAMAPRDKRREKVLVRTGPLKGVEVEIVGTLTIGRSPENGLQLNDLQVSRQHAVIQQTPAGAMLRDLGSGNGTFVGEKRIIEYRLQPGDVVTIGPVELLFEGSGTDFSGDATQAAADSVQFAMDEGSSIHAVDADSICHTFFQAPRMAKSAEQLRVAQNRLAAVYEANQIIASERDLDTLFARVMDQIFSLVPAHNGVILLKSEVTGAVTSAYATCRDQDSQTAEQPQITVSSSIVGRALEQAQAVITFDAAGDSRFEKGASIIAQNISSAMCTPLRYQEESVGVLYVDTRGTTNAFTEGDLELLTALAGPAAIAIKNAEYVAKLERSYQDTLVGLANAIEMRDHYTVGHNWRVTNFAIELARALGWPEEKLRECEKGGLLHDVGKIAVDDAILRKPSQLTDEEFAKMRIHPVRGARMMQDIEMLVSIIPYALYHHERIDGGGYPFGLKGEDIPIEGRVVAVADMFDAMTSNRPYRKGLDPAEAIERLLSVRGTQLDPACVDAFVEVFRQGRITGLLQEHHKGEKSVVCPFCSTYIEIPDGANVGDQFLCAVCRRTVRLQIKNEAYYGELVAETDRPNTAAAPSPASSSALDTPGE